MVLATGGLLRRLAQASGLACALLCCASPVAAWTRASVETADAHVQVLPSGRASVALGLGIRVYGGWLSRFELSGLGRDLTLDEGSPAVIECEDGRTLTPSLRADAQGRVVVTLGDKASAPRRGLHRLVLRYVTTLSEGEASDGSSSTLAFSLPAFAVDLKQADLWLEAPPGTRLLQKDTDVALGVERTERPDATLLHLHRARLPRTVAFGVELALSVPRQPASKAASPFHLGHHSAGAFIASGLLLALCALKRRTARISAARCNVRARPLLELPFALRASVMGIAGLAAALSYGARPDIGLALLALCVALALERGFSPIPDTSDALLRKPAPWHRLLFGGASWLDATTPLGAGLLGSAYALAFLRLGLGQGPGLWLETLILATPLWLTGTRMQMQCAEPHFVGEGPLRTGVPPQSLNINSAGASPRAPGRAA
ncbi:MAG: hypothetical protein ACHQ53_08420 [Polyangiales bacterium]